MHRIAHLPSVIGPASKLYRRRAQHDNKVSRANALVANDERSRGPTQAGAPLRPQQAGGFLDERSSLESEIAEPNTSRPLQLLQQVGRPIGTRLERQVQVEQAHQGAPL